MFSVTSFPIVLFRRLPDLTGSTKSKMVCTKLEKPISQLVQIAIIIIIIIVKHHLPVSESEVKRAVLSFPSGSAGGTDSLRPQHLKDLISCRESGSDFGSALTQFVNIVLEGRCPKQYAQSFLVQGRLIGLNKNDGGIRPIAIGFSLRRLVSKCANSSAITRVASLLCPR